MKAAEMNLYCRRGEDLIQPLAFAFVDPETGDLTEYDYSDCDFALVVESEREGADIVVASVDNGGILKEQEWTTLIPGIEEAVTFKDAILIHITNAITDTIEAGEYPLTLIRTCGSIVDKSVLGTLTVEKGGKADG
ncbi:MAG: hypothetical protein WDA41_07570 [Candidatus Neomarinimicrobiota bacterium]